MGKNIFFIQFFIVLLSSCNLFQPSNVFDSGKLRGKYRIDISPALRKAMNEGEKDDELEGLGVALAAWVMSSVDMEMNFYDNQKGVIYLDGGLVNFANAFADKDIKTTEFEYKVENDSILYFKFKGGLAETSDYQKWAIVRKFSDSYDYIQLVIVENGKESAIFNLRKIAE